jgi:hypothetical protein
MLRLAALSFLLLVALSLNVGIFMLAPYTSKQLQPFLSLWLLSFLPYFLACLFLRVTKPLQGRLRWIELALILLGALILRAVLVPLPPHPGLSPDSWRYLWDAKVTLLGYSPYVYPPSSPQFRGLHDLLFQNIYWRDVPTIYPPAAQAVYLVSYLLAAGNLFFLKGIFVGCDLLSCGLIMLLLRRRGLDPARALLYAWCPLPIIEFALQGHVDVLTILFSLLTVLAALRIQRSARGWTGFWLALTTLTKLYPLVFLVAVWRRGERLLLLVVVLTIGLSYLPYLILGHGQVLGFFATYLGEHALNGGPLRLIVGWLDDLLHLDGPVRLYAENLLFVGMLGGTALALWLLRQKDRMSSTAALLILTGAIFFISPHVFPWYTTALLPWVAILVRPLWSARTGFNPQGLVVGAAWYLACCSIMSYFIVQNDWTPYYWFVYGPVWLALLLAGGWTVVRGRSLPKRMEGVERIVPAEQEERPVEREESNVLS